MARTFIRQPTQVRKSDSFVDTIQANQTNFETNAVSIQDDLNSIRSQLNNLLNVSGSAGAHWYNDLSAPVTFEQGSKRGVQTLNESLHDLERKRVLVSTLVHEDIYVDPGSSFVILSSSFLPSNKSAAIGGTSTLTGSVAAYNPNFGSADLALVSGSSTINPLNIGIVIDPLTHDALNSAGNNIYALFQTESNTDGSVMSATSPNRAQLTFVRVDSTGMNLEVCPAADIGGKTIHYSLATRKALKDLNEQDFLKTTQVDIPSIATISRQYAYNNQGTAIVNITDDASLEIDATGKKWKILDDASQVLFEVHNDTAGASSEIKFGVDVDVFTSNAVVNTFEQGATFDDGGTAIEVGVTAGTIKTTSTNDLKVFGAGHLYLGDQHVAGSTWSSASGVRLSDSTSEWDEFESYYGAEKSIIGALNMAHQQDRKAKVYANVIADVPANTDVGGVIGGSNLDQQLPDMSAAGKFLTSFDVFINGELVRPGATSSTNNDYYPGTSLADGQLKFEFDLKIGDVICVIPYI